MLRFEDRGPIIHIQIVDPVNIKPLTSVHGPAVKHVHRGASTTCPQGVAKGEIRRGRDAMPVVHLHREEHPVVVPIAETGGLWEREKLDWIRARHRTA